jgi:pimeloyl-ACP methyl ester carboxylesterase
MKADPNHKFYGLWSVNDVLEYYKTDPPTPQDIRNIASSFKTYNAYSELFKIKHQALLLTASGDNLVPMALMRQIHEKMVNSVLIVIENAGHESPKSRAPEVNKAIIEFLE